MQGRFAIKGGDATKGALTVYYDGARPRNPSTERWPNSTDAPMQKQGSIILGIGGDNSHRAVGTFYEGKPPAHVPEHAMRCALRLVPDTLAMMDRGLTAWWFVRCDDSWFLLHLNGCCRASQYCRCRLLQVKNVHQSLIEDRRIDDR